MKLHHYNSRTTWRRRREWRFPSYAQVRGSTASELSALTTTWLQSKQLDGFLFFYRSHPTVTVSDAEFLGHFRRLRDDLGLVGLFVSAVVSFHKEQPEGPMSINNVLALVEDIVVLRTHDLSPVLSDAAACPMPFALGGVTRAPSFSRLMHDMKEAMPDFEQSIAPRLLFSVTCEASSYFLNSSTAFHEGDPAVKMTTGSTYWQMCEMAAKLGYMRHYSRHGDCHVVHKDRFWQAGLGPHSTRLFIRPRRRSLALLSYFAMHADRPPGCRCWAAAMGWPINVRRSLDRFVAALCHRSELAEVLEKEHSVNPRLLLEPGKTILPSASPDTSITEAPQDAAVPVECNTASKVRSSTTPKRKRQSRSQVTPLLEALEKMQASRAKQEEAAVKQLEERKKWEEAKAKRHDERMQRFDRLIDVLSNKDGL
ncbi:hypothetical protein HPB51_028115 [Rhipicephalus microplus]|uniref:Uncharacterized protein n=1 Tax=Rhipicephalus microplus TaxID=6941 RepID=A0A9J6CY60_RHIMP|nr:hypothetical protein HPB51_028115 [Rhipicephalus microplus]